jgi:MinD superfamily P-loop ATPase
MRIAIASGKGGTGKTTVAANLAVYLNSLGKRVSFVDCDVEEPNAHFFLQPRWSREETQTVPVPSIDEEACLGEPCQLCIRECRFNALIWMVRSVMVFPELCHSCGLCAYICPADAVSFTTRDIGTLRMGQGKGVEVTGGLLRIGEAMAPPLIKKVKTAAPDGDVQIVDAPPGSSCPVIEALDGADYVLLVAEPTPFGLFDLRIAAELMRKTAHPFGVVINRDGMGDEQTERFLEAESVPVLARFPYSPEAAASYSRGELLIETQPGFRELYARLWSALQAGIEDARGADSATSVQDD